MTTAHKETGGPAFPVPAGCGEEWGMTLRDYFAAKAMHGLMSIEASETKRISVLAKIAYNFADAMLEARNYK